MFSDDILQAGMGIHLLDPLIFLVPLEGQWLLKLNVKTISLSKSAQSNNHKMVFQTCDKFCINSYFKFELLRICVEAHLLKK